MLQKDVIIVELYGDEVEEISKLLQKLQPENKKTDVFKIPQGFEFDQIPHMLAFKRYLEVQNEIDIKVAISSRGVINFESEKEL